MSTATARPHMSLEAIRLSASAVAKTAHVLWNSRRDSPPSEAMGGGLRSEHRLDPSIFECDCGPYLDQRYPRAGGGNRPLEPRGQRPEPGGARALEQADRPEARHQRQDGSQPPEPNLPEARRGQPDPGCDERNEGRAAHGLSTPHLRSRDRV